MLTRDCVVWQVEWRRQAGKQKVAGVANLDVAHFASGGHSLGCGGSAVDPPAALAAHVEAALDRDGRVTHAWQTEVTTSGVCGRLRVRAAGEVQSACGPGA